MNVLPTRLPVDGLLSLLLNVISDFDFNAPIEAFGHVLYSLTRSRRVIYAKKREAAKEAEAVKLPPSSTLLRSSPDHFPSGGGSLSASGAGAIFLQYDDAEGWRRH